MFHLPPASLSLLLPSPKCFLLRICSSAENIAFVSITVIKFIFGRGKDELERPMLHTGKIAAVLGMLKDKDLLSGTDRTAAVFFARLLLKYFCLKEVKDWQNLGWQNLSPCTTLASDL